MRSKRKFTKLSLNTEGIIQFKPRENISIFKKFYSELSSYLKKKLPIVANNFVSITTKDCYSDKSSVINKRVNLKTGVSRKQSTANFLKNEHFLPPDTHTNVCVLQGKKCSFFGKFGVLCFLETPVLRFTLLPYYRRVSLTRRIRSCC